MHVEDGERRQQLGRALGVHRLVEEVLRQLGQAHLAVLVRVVQVEVDFGEDAAGDAGARDAQVQFGRRRQPDVLKDERLEDPSQQLQRQYGKTDQRHVGNQPERGRRAGLRE